jgi:hypothetical protein
MGISAGDETAKYRTWAFPPATKRQNTIHRHFRRRRNGKIPYIGVSAGDETTKYRTLAIFREKKRQKCRILRFCQRKIEKIPEKCTFCHENEKNA